MTQTIRKTYTTPVTNVVEIEGESLIAESPNWDEAKFYNEENEGDFTD